MKTVNLQVRINEDLKQEVSSILKAQGLSYTSMLDALFRQIIKERRIPFWCITVMFYDALGKAFILGVRVASSSRKRRCHH